MSRRIAALALALVGCQVNLGLTLQKADGGGADIDAGPLFTYDAGPPCPGVDGVRCEGVCYDRDSDREHCGHCANACGEDERCEGGECVFNPCEGAAERLCPDERTFENTTPGSILDGQEVVRTVVVSEARVPLELHAEVGFTHPSHPDLIATVEHDGTVETIFDDIVTVDEQTTYPRALTAFSLDQLDGVWTFRVRDRAAGDEGVLERVALRLVFGPAVCVDTVANPQSCGVCGNHCGVGATCEEGACQCPPGELLCEGWCDDPQTSSSNCGGCRNSCRIDEECRGGSCLPCSTVCAGVCRDFQTDRNHCGRCDTQCADFAECVDGECVEACPATTQRCDGVCVPNDSDAHCGSCGRACAAGTACVAGACVNCGSAGLVACESDCADVSISQSDCGGCGTTCMSGPFLGEYCLEGSCTVADLDWRAAGWDAACRACVAGAIAEERCGVGSNPLLETCATSAECAACIETGTNACTGCTCPGWFYGCLSQTCPGCGLERNAP